MRAPLYGNAQGRGQNQECGFPLCARTISAERQVGLVALLIFRVNLILTPVSREFGTAERSEFTVVKVEAYNGINAYLSELTDTNMKSLESIVKFNEMNAGTEGGLPRVHPAFASGQDNFNEIVLTHGVEDETYHRALQYIQHQSREGGIDAALKLPGLNDDPEGPELDALIMCDRKGVGQQMAAQAGELSPLSHCKGFDLIGFKQLGYPIISVPIGVDKWGLPVGICLLQKAWKEGILVRYASAIEALRDLSGMGPRPAPQFKRPLAKNIPIIK